MKKYILFSFVLMMANIAFSQKIKFDKIETNDGIAYRLVGTTTKKIPLSDVEIVPALLPSQENFGDVKSMEVSMMAFDSSKYLVLSFINNNYMSKYTLKKVQAFDSNGQEIPITISENSGLGRVSQGHSKWIMNEYSRFSNLLFLRGGFNNGISKLVLTTFNTDKMVVNLKSDNLNTFVVNANTLINNTINVL